MSCKFSAIEIDTVIARQVVFNISLTKNQANMAEKVGQILLDYHEKLSQAIVDETIRLPNRTFNGTKPRWIFINALLFTFETLTTIGNEIIYFLP